MNASQLAKKRQSAVLSISAKCNDLFSHVIYSKDGSIYREYGGYVPSFMPGEHYGDYVMLDIDPYTGQILNWKNWTHSKEYKGNPPPVITRAELYKEAFNRAFVMNRGDVTLTAKTLGIGRATAYRHLKKFGIKETYKRG